MQVESSGAPAAPRFLNEIYLRPGVPGEDQLIVYLDNITGKGGQTEYLHLALNRGLVILRNKIANMQSQGKTKDAILASFAVENTLLYRVAFLYFAALENMQQMENEQGITPNNKSEKPTIAPERKSVVASSLAISDDGKGDEEGNASGVVAAKKPDWSNLKGLASGKAGGVE